MSHVRSTGKRNDRNGKAGNAPELLKTIMPDEKGILRCPLCKFSSKKPHVMAAHMQEKHDCSVVMPKPPGAKPFDYAAFYAMAQEYARRSFSESDFESHPAGIQVGILDKENASLNNTLTLEADDGTRILGHVEVL